MLSFGPPGTGPKSLFWLHQITKRLDALPVRMTGIRVWKSRTNSFGSPVMIVLLMELEPSQCDTVRNIWKWQRDRARNVDRPIRSKVLEPPSPLVAYEK